MRRATYDDDDDHDDQCCHAIFGKSQDESEHRCPKGEEVFFLSICDYLFCHSSCYKNGVSTSEGSGNIVAFDGLFAVVSLQQHLYVSAKGFIL